MVPRLQCLRAVHHVGPRVPYFRAAFSSIMRAMADPPSQSRDLLGSLSNKPPRVSPATFSNKPPRVSPATRAGITLPTRNDIPQQINAVGEVLNIARQSLRRPASEETRQEADDLRLGAALSQHVKRRWKAGDLYAPHDLSPEETQKYKRKKAPQYDIFDVLEMNPLDEYKNFSIMNSPNFITKMGRIRHSKFTGLRPVNQRRIAKAIRRAIGIGLLPSAYRHPELIYKQSDFKMGQQIGDSKARKVY